MRQWLPPGHAAFAVMEAVGQLDLDGFYAAYRADGQGRVPYDPAVMLGLLSYCYLKGIRSTRKIGAACIDDVGCRVIGAGAAPSHQAFATFSSGGTGGSWRACSCRCCRCLRLRA